jgi:hypothetical protein
MRTWIVVCAYSGSIVILADGLDVLERRVFAGDWRTLPSDKLPFAKITWLRWMFGK